MSTSFSRQKTWQRETVEITGVFRKKKHEFAANDRGAGCVIGEFMPDGAPAPVSLKCSTEVGVPVQGHRYRISGYWSSYSSKSKWAKNKETVQFVAEAMDRCSEMDFAAFSAYVSKIVQEEKIPGIGMGRISRIWKVFGAESLSKIREVSAAYFNERSQGMTITQESWAHLARAVHERQATESTMSEILKLIAGSGFQKSIATDAFKQWGASAPSRIRRNAFCLMTAKLPSAGFKRCDELYRKLGGNPKRLKRLMLRIWYEIKGGVQGNVWTEERQLRQAVKDTIETEFTDFGIPKDKDIDRLLERAIQLGLRSKWLARETTRGPFGGIIEPDVKEPLRVRTSWIASGELDRAEKSVAKTIAERCSGKHLNEGPGQWSLMHVLGRLNLSTDDLNTKSVLNTISEHQVDAIRTSVGCLGFGVLTGGPGTGKTRTTCAFLELAAVAARKFSGLVMACGPTGKSVTRLRESYTNIFTSTTAVQFTTWHYALAFQDASTPVLAIVGDEHSMTDIELMHEVLKKWPNAIYLFVGDDGQLPPVGPGHVLRDMMNSKMVPVARLTETYRNEGGIVTICDAILNKKSWEPHGNVLLHKCEDPNDIVDAVATRIASATIEGFNPRKDVQVICAVNEKGPASKLLLNLALQDLMNEGNKNDARIPKWCPFRVGDKVVCRKNGTYEVTSSLRTSHATSVRASVYGNASVCASVCNGDQGTVFSFADDGGSMVVALADEFETQVIVKFNEDDARSYHKGVRCHWELAYAISCHSSQGSEWPLSLVVLDPSTSASGICTLEWLRVAISRGKHRCEMFGTMETARKFCKKSGRDRRKTLLAERIQREKEMLEFEF